MFTRLTCALTASILAAPSFAAPFSVNIVDVEGGPAGNGQPYTVTGGTFLDYYTGAPIDVFDALTGPNPALFPIDPQLQFDSYLAMDGGGPSAQFPSYWANQPSTSRSIAFSPGTSGITSTTVSAAYFHAGPAVPSGVDSLGNDVMFLGRLAVTGGATIINNNIELYFGGAAAGTVVGFALNGPAVNAPDNTGALQPMQITSTLVLSSSVRGDGAGVDVYDIWSVVVVPTPGTGLLASAAMILATPRRRRPE